MCNCKSLTDRLEDMIDKAVVDQDWQKTAVLQDILEAILPHRNDVAESALRELIDTGISCLIF